MALKKELWICYENNARRANIGGARADRIADGRRDQQKDSYKAIAKFILTG